LGKTSKFYVIGWDGINQVQPVPVVLWSLKVFLNLGLLVGYSSMQDFCLIYYMDFVKWGNDPRRRL
jgi:hypothetical protein